MNRNIRQLETLAAMVLDAELAQLKALSQEVATRNGELAALGEARTARAEALRAGTAKADLAFLTGQDARWAGWLAQTGARLTREAAQAAARREEQRLRAKKAFGKRDALRQMRERAEAERGRHRTFEG